MNSSSSSSSDEGDPSGATAERTESVDAEIAATETVSGAKDVAAEVSFTDESTASSTSSGEKGVEAGTSTAEDEVSMDELKAAEASFDSACTTSACKPRSAEGTIEEHATVGVVTSAERVVETTPITITNSGRTVQGDPSGSGSYVDPSLLNSSPSTRHYVRRTRRGSMVSTYSERTISATIRVPTPPSALHESGGAAPTPKVVTAVVPATITVQESGTILAVAEEIPGDKEVPVHIPDIQEGNNIVESTPINENLVVDTDFDIGVTQIEHAEVVASEDPVQADVTPGSDVPVMEEAFVQNPANDVSMEDMADTHDSYDVILAETEDHVAGTQAADMEVTAPVTAHTSPTKTGIWCFIMHRTCMCISYFLVMNCLDMG